MLIDHSAAPKQVPQIPNLLSGPKTSKRAPQPLETASADQRNLPMISTEVTSTTTMADKGTIEDSLHVAQLQTIRTETERQIADLYRHMNGPESPIEQKASIPQKRKAPETKSVSEDGNATDGDHDDDDDDDDDDAVASYNPSKQSLPHLPIYHPAFKVAEETAGKTLEAFTDMIKASSYKDEEARHLRKEIVSQSQVPYGQAVRIGLLGEAGAGKSSVINSILGTPNLTVEADGGDSGTCLVIEFVQSTGAQKKPFAAHVEFFAKEYAHRLVKGFFVQWYKYQQRLLTTPDETDDMEMDEANTARDCLQTLFADHEEMADEVSAENFLNKATSDSDPIILAKLLKWTTDILHTFVPANENELTFESDTPETLTEQFMPFTRQTPHASYNGVPMTIAPWPLVQKVRISLDSPILGQGIVLADLPGTSDINKCRIDATMRYMKTCDYTIVVGKIDRAEHSANLKNHYMEAFRRRRSGSVILVITRSDDLNIDNASTVQHEVQDEEQLAFLTESLKDLAKQQTTIGATMEKNRANGQQKLNKKLKVQKSKLSKRVKGLEHELKKIRILARNEKVTKTLVQHYRMDTKDDIRVPVFCVSNRMYMRHLRGYEKDDPPDMGLEETQIPALCSHIYALPSRGKFATLDHYCRISLSTLMNIIEMSCSTTTVARRKHLVDMIEQAHGKIKQQVDELITSFCSTSLAALVEALQSSSLQTSFENGARQKLRQWASLSAPGHRAFVRHYGNYKTSKIPRQNWNEELLMAVTAGIDGAFKSIIDDSCEALRAEAAQSIQEIMSSLNDDLRSDPQALVGNVYKLCFLDNLPRHQEEIAKIIEKSARGLRLEFINMHQKATKAREIRDDDEDREGDYFMEAMVDIYEDCDISQPVKRKTLHQTRCEMLEERILAPRGPFAAIADNVQNHGDEAMARLGKEFKLSIGKILKRIQTDFERMSVKKTNDTPEAQRFRKESHACVKEAKKILDGPIQAALDLCREYK